MPKPDTNATIATFTPERLAREIAFALGAIDLKDAATCDWLSTLLARHSERLAGNPNAFEALSRDIANALEGDSYDAERDALVSAADQLGIPFTPPEE
jgi:hypothetical protein